MSNAQSPNCNETGLIEDLSWLDKSLAKLLEPDEKVLVRLEGVDLSGLVCTDQRVIVFHTGHFTWFLGNVRSFYSPYDRITDVSVTPSLRIQPLLGGGYVFEVVTPEMGAGATVAGSMFEFAAEPNRIGFPKAKGEILGKVIGMIQERIASAPRVDPVPLNPTAEEPTSDSPVKMLEKLADLKARGVLTEEEFQAQKQKVLEKL
jgi:hypothetical protein